MTLVANCRKHRSDNRQTMTYLQVLGDQLPCFRVACPLPVARDALHAAQTAGMRVRHGTPGMRSSSPTCSTCSAWPGIRCPVGQAYHHQQTAATQGMCAETSRIRRQAHPDVSGAHHAHHRLRARLLSSLPQPPAHRQGGLFELSSYGIGTPIVTCAASLARACPPSSGNTLYTPARMARPASSQQCAEWRNATPRPSASTHRARIRSRSSTITFCMAVLLQKVGNHNNLNNCMHRPPHSADRLV